MGAIQTGHEPTDRVFDQERCIGCGLCVVKCGSRRAIEMKALPGYQRPPRLFTTTILRNAPNYVINAVNAWKKYINQGPDPRGIHD